MDKINQLTYNDFKLLEIIDPDQFDTNFTQLVTKIDEIIQFVNEVSDNTGGTKVGIVPPSGVAGATVKQVVDALKTLIDTLNTTVTTNDGKLTTHKTSSDHDSRYYTESEIDTKIGTLNTTDTNNANALTTHKTSNDHDGRYYTETEIDTKIGTLNTTDTNNANALTTHKSSTDHNTLYNTKTEINTLITNLQNQFNVLYANTGADEIGAVAPTGMVGVTVQELLEELKLAIDAVALGEIPNNSITDIKLNDSPTDVKQRTGMYNKYASVKVGDVYTVVEYKRADNTLYMKSTLSNPDSNGFYQTDTVQIYSTNGTTLAQTITWTFVYDVDGLITEATYAIS